MQRVSVHLLEVWITKDPKVQYYHNTQLNDTIYCDSDTFAKYCNKLLWYIVFYHIFSVANYVFSHFFLQQSVIVNQPDWPTQFIQTCN